jgi:seryl-tRNA synthetase
MLYKQATKDKETWEKVARDSMQNEKDVCAHYESEQWKRIIATHVDVIVEQEIEIDHLEQDNLTLQAKIKELEAAQGKILKVCEPCGQEGIAEIEKLEQRIKELTEALEKYVELDKTRIAEAVLKESN